MNVCDAKITMELCDDRLKLGLTQEAATSERELQSIKVISGSQTHVIDYAEEQPVLSQREIKYYNSLDVPNGGSVGGNCRVYSRKC